MLSKHRIRGLLKRRVIHVDGLLVPAPSLLFKLMQEGKYLPPFNRAERFDFFDYLCNSHGTNSSSRTGTCQRQILLLTVVPWSRPDSNRYDPFRPNLCDPAQTRQYLSAAAKPNAKSATCCFTESYGESIRRKRPEWPPNPTRTLAECTRFPDAVHAVRAGGGSHERAGSVASSRTFNFTDHAAHGVPIAQAPRDARPSCHGVAKRRRKGGCSTARVMCGRTRLAPERAAAREGLGLPFTRNC